MVAEGRVDSTQMVLQQLNTILQFIFVRVPKNDVNPESDQFLKFLKRCLGRVKINVREYVQ